MKRPKRKFVLCKNIKRYSVKLLVPVVYVHIGSLSITLRNVVIVESNFFYLKNKTKLVFIIIILTR